MRAEELRRQTPGWDWHWVDTDEAMHGCTRIWQSLAFRCKTGRAVNAINAQVLALMPAGEFDLIWVDKGVFLWRTTVLELRRRASRLVHFTPDTAFHANRSRHFNRNLGLYDLLVTTKSFEMDAYRQRVDPNRLYLATQGFDAQVHFPRVTASGRRREVLFIGLAEPDRERCLGLLLEQGIPVRLGGKDWGRFLSSWGACAHLRFEGEGVFSDDYAMMLSESWVGLGLLSKRFPELHTTRTFEIPACGAILATEETADTKRYFGSDEAVFFQDYAALAVRLQELFANATDAQLASVAMAGRERVVRDGRDYAHILRAVLDDARVAIAGQGAPMPHGATVPYDARRIDRENAERENTNVNRASDNESVLGKEALCIGFLGADWWGSDALAMATDLRRRGHLVMDRHYEDYLPTKWRHPLLKAVRKSLRGLMARDYNRSVEELLDIADMDMLLVFKGMLLDPKTLARFKAMGIPCYCFYPDVSFHDHGCNIPACLPLYDCIFTTKRYHLDNPAVTRMAPEWRFAPHGFDPAVHRPVSRTGIVHATYCCDVSFVGFYSPKKEKSLAALSESMPALDLKIWGTGWGKARMAVRSYWQGRGAYGDEVTAIYSLSKINLGLLSEAGTGVNSGDSTTARSWQIPGAGGFLLHEDTSEIRAAFAEDKEVALFKGPEHLVAQVRRFLADDGARQAVAAAGHRRAMEEPYTYARAVDIILARHARRRDGAG